MHFCKHSSPQKNLIRPNYPNPRLFSESFIEENVCLFPTTIPNVNGSKNYLRFQIQLYFFNTLFSKVHQVLFKKLPDQNLPQNHLWAFTKSSVEESTQNLRTVFVNVFFYKKKLCFLPTMLNRVQFSGPSKIKWAKKCKILTGTSYCCSAPKVDHFNWKQPAAATFKTGKGKCSNSTSLDRAMTCISIYNYKGIKVGNFKSRKYERKKMKKYIYY